MSNIILNAEQFIVPKHKEVYPNNIRKKSKRARKPCSTNLGILEFGNAAVVIRLTYSSTLWQQLESWWEESYSEKGVDWNVELFTCQQGESGYIEVILFEKTAFWKTKCPKLTSVQDAPEVYFTKGLSLLPEEFHGAIETLTLEDWDYSTNEDRSQE